MQFLGTGNLYGNPLSPFGVAADGAGAYPPAADSPEGTNPPIQIGIADGQVTGRASGTLGPFGFNINLGGKESVRTPERTPERDPADVSWTGIPSWVYVAAGVAGLALLTRK